MKNIFEKDITLKIISLILAIGVWFYIIIVLNPSIESVVRDVPVQYVEQAKLTELGLSIVNEKRPTVEVKIKGKRNIISNINEKNIVATINLSSVNKIGTHTMPIMVSLPIEEVSVLEKKPYTIDVTVDKIVEVRKNIRVIASGNLQPGFIQGEIKVTPSTVLIKGTSSAVNDIKEAVVYFNYDGKNNDIIETQNIILINEAGNEVTASYPIIKDVDTVEINCPVMELKTIPVVPMFTDDIKNMIATGTLKLTMQPEAVMIYANSSVVAQIDQIVTDNINLKNVTQETDLTINLKIPDNIGMRDDISKVHITLTPKTGE